MGVIKGGVAGAASAIVFSATVLSPALAAAAPVTAAVAPLAFQDFTLGMDLDAAKGVKLPPDKYGSRFVACTDDPTKPAGLSPVDVEASAGIVRCWPSQFIGSSIVRSELKLSDEISATTELVFLNGKLVRIEAIMDEMHSSTILDALSMKYGAPVMTNGRAGNAYGATWEKLIYNWSLGPNAIRFTTPDLTSERMSVIYRDVRGSAEANAKLDRVRAAKVRL